MSLTLINIILLLAAAQGFFLSALLLHKYRDFFANRILAVLIIIYSLVLLNLFFSDIGYYIRHPALMIVPMGFPFLLGPIHFLYAKYIIQNRQKFKKQDLIHFLPFIICILYFVMDFVKADTGFDHVTLPYEDKGYPWVLFVFNWILIFQASLYIFMTLIMLKKFTRYMKDTFSSLDKVKLDWLKYITYFIGFGLFIFLIENTLLMTGINLSDYFNLSSVLIAIYVYTIGYTGFLKAEIFTHSEISKSITEIPQASYRYRLESGQEKESEKYEKSGLTQEMAKKHFKDLLDLMESANPYRNSNLALNDLAEKLSISPHNLSEVINTQMGQSFFDLINHYRVEQVKKDLSNTKKHNLTLLSIATDAGFNSKSSFNAIFKKVTGITPSQFRKKYS